MYLIHKTNKGYAVYERIGKIGSCFPEPIVVTLFHWYGDALVARRRLTEGLDTPSQYHWEAFPTLNHVPR